MLIEYKIKFEKDGVTITQSSDAGSAASEAAPDNPVHNSLKATAKESEPANAEAAPPAAGPNDRPKLGGGPNDRPKLGGGPNDRERGGGPNDRERGGAADGESLPMTIIDPFKIDEQKELNWCWAAVAATVSRYFFPGRPLKQCQIAKSVLDPDGGGADCCKDPTPCDQAAGLDTALSAVNKYLAKEGLNQLNNQTVTGKFLTFGAIREQIDAGRPVCARIQWSGGSRGHFVMISGYSISETGEHWVDVADPFYGNSILPYEQFVHAYHGDGEWNDSYLVGQS